MYFSDMLGDHTLAAAVQFTAGSSTNFSLKNTAAQVMYLNQAHRWNWGVVGSQIPYLSGGVQEYIDPVNNQLVDQTFIFRQTELSASGILAYPLNRARRIEFQTGITQISFDQVVETQAYSLNTGQLIADETNTTTAAPSLTLGTTSAAFVHDTSSFGATSPVQGQRYRIEAAPTFGSIDYTSVLADYRRYFMPVRFYTIAVRGLHYGRYGSAGSDQRLYPLYVGYPSLVRGYDVYTLDPNECHPTATTSCPEYDRLLGTRMLVGNVELRFPLLRPFGVSQNMYGPLPVEVALFADGGVAYDAGESPKLLGGKRQGVSSVGVALRANLMGFAVGQFDFSRPLQRPEAGWIFQFNLSPGF
jgi:outer membrane protein assembly factor BamA